MKTIQVSAKDFFGALRSCHASTGNSFFRPATHNVFLHNVGLVLKAVSTDSYTMAIESIKSSNSEDFSFYIHKKEAKNMMKTKDTDGIVEIKIHDPDKNNQKIEVKTKNHFHVFTSNTTKNIIFPQYNSAIPKTETYSKITITEKELSRIVRDCLATNKSREEKLPIFERFSILLKTQSGKLTTTTTDYKQNFYRIKSDDGIGINDVKINFTYLSRILKNRKKEEIEVLFDPYSRLSPLCFKKGESFFLIMPMSIL